MGFGHETQELGGEINLFDLTRPELRRCFLPKWKVDGRHRGVAESIPNAVKFTPGVIGWQKRQKSFELGVVRAVVLGVYLPDKGLMGPNGPHQRVLTPHKIKVTSP